MQTNLRRTAEELEQFSLFKEGSERAFQYFYELYHRPLYLFVRNLLRDDAVAEEITNDTFIVLGRDRLNINSTEHLERFLFFVARRLTLARLMKMKKDLKEHQAWARYHFDWITQYDDVDMVQDRALSLIYQHIQKLSEKQRDIFILYFAKRKRVKSIAKLIGTSEKNVYKHLDKIRQYLTSVLSRNSLVLIFLITICN